eukprot:jgi/Chlat1/483/Chrsp103S01077
MSRELRRRQLLEEQQDEEELPWPTIGLAIALFLVGGALLSVGILMWLGAIDGGLGTGVALTFLGALLFIPGLWVVRTAYYAWKGYDGYDFHDMPEV